MSKLPHTVKVGPHTYKVVTKPAAMMQGKRGWCMYRVMEIWLLAGMRRSHMQEILLHEILHACCYPNEEKLIKEEDFVKKMSPNLVHVLQENPEVTAYICG